MEEKMPEKISQRSVSSRSRHHDRKYEDRMNREKIIQSWQKRAQNALRKLKYGQCGPAQYFKHFCITLEP